MGDSLSVPVPVRVVIVGGGISGLATAHALVKASREAATAAPLEIVVLERSGRLGGNIVTVREQGFTIDGGPDSWVANKPQATKLAGEVGLEGGLMPTIEATRHVYVAHDDELHLLPEGLVLAVPTRIMPVAKSRLFSWRGKLRMALEPLVRKRPKFGEAGDAGGGGEGDDESVGDFVSRRLGREVTERLAGPLLGGIFAGDASTLSIRATFPQFVEMEQSHGSLVRAMRAQRATMAKMANASKANGGGNGEGKSKASPSAFLSLRGGMGTLIDAVAKEVLASGCATTRTSTTVRGITPLPLGGGDARGRYAVDIDGQEPIFADHVVLAAPAHAAARALRGIDGELAAQLEVLRYASTATAFLAFRREQVVHPLDAVGFIVPRAAKRPILAATWVSSKWENRAPGGHVLMRVFFGGAWGEQILDRDDAALAATGLEELRRFIRIDGAPQLTKVFRFHQSNPQPLVGHLGRLAKIRERLARFPGLYVVGSGYDGVGIPDCVRQASRAAIAIIASTKGV